MVSLKTSESECCKTAEAVARRCSVKKVFIEISQNSRENTCSRVSFLIKLPAWGPATLLLKKRLWHKCFPLNFAKFLRTPFLTEHLRRLLLKQLKIILQICTTSIHYNSKIYFIFSLLTLFMYWVSLQLGLVFQSLERWTSTPEVFSLIPVTD